MDLCLIYPDAQRFILILFECVINMLSLNKVILSTRGCAF